MFGSHMRDPCKSEVTAVLSGLGPRCDVMGLMLPSSAALSTWFSAVASAAWPPQHAGQSRRYAKEPGRAWESDFMSTPYLGGCTGRHAPRDFPLLLRWLGRFVRYFMLFYVVELLFGFLGGFYRLVGGSGPPRATSYPYRRQH